MKFVKINKINKTKKHCYDITVANNHNFFCNGFLIHNCDFRGEIGVIICNLSNEPFIINHGDRIAQLALTKVTRFKWHHVDYLNPAQRDSAGFGTTGIK